MKSIDTPRGIKRRVTDIFGQVDQSSFEMSGDSVQGVSITNLERLSKVISSASPDGVRGGGYSITINSGTVEVGSGTGISNKGDIFEGAAVVNASYNNSLIASSTNYVYVIGSAIVTGDDYNFINGQTSKITYDNEYYVFVTTNKADAVSENAVLVSTLSVDGSLVATEINNGNQVHIATGLTDSFNITDPSDSKEYELSFVNGLLVSKTEVTP